MEVFGNIEALKGAIEKRYTSKIKEVEKEKEKALSKIDNELQKELGVLRPHMETITDAEVKKTHSMILSEEKLKVKREFEEKRESIISSVFKEARKKAKKVAHSTEYMDFVKKNMPEEEDISIIGDSEYHKKIIPGLKVDKNIIGVRVESKGAIYDFTLDNMIASKKDILRHEVSKVLFS
jgi:vacuolar-type H+-ATPase subunit E/Vma4